MGSSNLRHVLIATQNSGKLSEFRRLLHHLPAKFVDLDEIGDVEAPVEDGATFLENALIKARFYSEHFGGIALADDSGLVVDALGGGPGVHSARYGGDGFDDEGRTRLLLSNMAEVPQGERTARFVCAVVVCGTDAGAEYLYEFGVVEGTIGFEPRGANGFGYDPVFVPTGERRTTAEMSAEEKDALSHRGRAIKAIAPALTSLL